MTGALIITVGIPGSGKSRHAQHELDCGDIDLIVSTDQIRQELTGDMTSMDRNPEVFSLLYRRVAEGLGAGQRVLVDATNLRPHYRETLWAIGNAANVPRWAYLFADSLDFDLCQQRNVNRERVVPEDVMRRMHAHFVEYCNPATLTLEGWDIEIHQSVR